MEFEVKKGEAYITSTEKRCLDVASSIALIAMTSPGMAAVVLGTMAENRTCRNIMYRSTRKGKNGQDIVMPKFRTLWKEVNVLEPFSGADDPRAKALAKVWRKTRMDELPQLWSILVGDLSAVGRRPLCDEHTAQAKQFLSKSEFDKWEYGGQISAGAVSPAQLVTSLYDVQTPSVIRMRVGIDNDYFDNASLFEDVKVLAKTPWVLGQVALGRTREAPDAHLALQAA